MKYFFVLTLSFFVILFSAFSVSAQEAKLIKQGEWGSGDYQQIITINGLYYIKTAANQIDVIDPALNGKESLIAQLDFYNDLSFEQTEYFQINFIYNYKGYLVLATNDKVNIYSVKDNSKLTLVYSLSVPNIDYTATVTSNDNYLIFSTSDENIYIVEEVLSVFKLTKVVQAKNDNVEDGHYVHYQNLVIDGTELYYVSSFSSDISATATSIKSYDLTTFSLLNSAQLENFAIRTSEYVNNKHFVFHLFDRLALVRFDKNQVDIINNFNDEFYFSSQLLFNNNILRVYNYGRFFYSFEIRPSGDVLLLSRDDMFSKLPGNSTVTELAWLNGKLLALSSSYGLYEYVLDQNSVIDVNFIYNQSGFAGKAIVKNDNLYIPRKERIDIVDVSNLSNINMIDSTSIKANAIYTNSDNSYIFSNDSEISNYFINSSTDIQLNSAFSLNSTVEAVTTDSHFYTIGYDDSNDVSLYKYKNNYIYSFFESPVKISLTDISTCPNQLNLIKNKILVFDYCDNQLYLFLNNENIDYNNSLPLPAAWFHLVKDDYIYALNPNNIVIYKLDENDSLKQLVTFVEGFPLNGTINNAKILDQHLLISTNKYLYLYDVREPLQPKFISKTELNEWQWPKAEFQLFDKLVVISTKHQGKVKLFSINTSPTVGNKSFTLDEDTEVVFDLLLTDAEGDEIILSPVQTPQYGNIVINSDNTITYNPTNDYNGSDSALLKVEDNYGNFIEAELLFDIISVNDAPVLGNNSFFTNEDTILTTTINVSDVDSTELTYELVEPSVNATVNINPQGEFIYTPNTNYTGIDQFTVSVSDNLGAKVEGVIIITVEDVNDAPMVINNSFETDEDITLNGVIEATDVESQALSFSLLEQSELQGNLNLATDGSFTFIPNENFFGSTSFIVKVTDTGNAFVEQLITIHVNPIDDIPAVDNLTVSTVSGEKISGNLPLKDVDNQTLSYRIIKDVSNGVLTFSDNGEYQYTPNTGFLGVDTFTYEVQDTTGNTVQAIISFTVIAKVDPKSSESSGGSFYYLVLLLLFIRTYKAKKK